MDALLALKVRRSIRTYRNKPVSRKILEKIVDAARFAPTARGVQPWEFIVITERSILEKIGAIAENGRFVAKAACCIAVFCVDTKYYLEDGCAATENILIAAAALRIGSCWVAGDKKPYAQEIGDLLNVPRTIRLVSLIALGYSESRDGLQAPDKRPLNQVIHWEKF